MNKSLAVLVAGALALTFGGIVSAAEKDQNTRQPQVRQPVEDPAAGGATTSQKEQEYLAALKKCEPLTGAEKDHCIDVARKKYGQM
jgi:hypothetical protein